MSDGGSGCNIRNELKRIRQAGERWNEMTVTWYRDGASEYLGVESIGLVG